MAVDGAEFESAAARALQNIVLFGYASRMHNGRFGAGRYARDAHVEGGHSRTWLKDHPAGMAEATSARFSP
jgi:hypothetical protein